MATLTVNQKKGLVGELITNGAWEEEDREWLESLSEKRLQVLVANAIEDSEEEGPEDDDDTDDEFVDLEDDVQPTKNGKAPPFAKKGAKKPAPVEETDDEEEEEAPTMKPNCNQSVDDYIANAPAEVQELLFNGLDALKRERVSLLKSIVGENKAITKNEFAELNKLSTSQLKTLAKVTNNGRPNRRYDLANIGLNDVLANNQAGGDEEPLLLPELNAK